MDKDKPPGIPFLPCIIFFALASGCATMNSSHSLSPSFSIPQRIAILPFDNESTDLDASGIMRDLVRINLIKKGYALMDTTRIDSILRKKLAITDGGQLRAVKPSQIGEALGADALFYGAVEDFRFVPAGAYTERTAGVHLKLIRALDGAALFENETKASDRTIEVTANAMIRAGAEAAGEKLLQRFLGHPVRPIAAAAVNKNLRPLPATPSGMPDFGGRTRDEISLGERCILFITIDPQYGIWVGTEVDPFTESPICYSPTGDKNFDKFFDDANLFTAKVRLAATIAYLRKTGRTMASNGRPISEASAEVQPLLTQALEDVPKILQDGKQLLLSLSSTRFGKAQGAAEGVAQILKALQLVKISKTLFQTIQNLTAAIEQGKAALDDLREKPPENQILADSPPADAIGEQAKAAIAQNRQEPNEAAPPDASATTIDPANSSEVNTPHDKTARDNQSFIDRAIGVAENKQSDDDADRGKSERYLEEAQSLIGEGDWARASKELLAAAATLPRNDIRRVYITERLGYLALRRHRLEKAKRFYLAAIKFAKINGVSNGSLYDAYIGLAYCLSSQGDRSAAVRNYRKASELTKNDDMKHKINERIVALNTIDAAE